MKEDLQLGTTEAAVRSCVSIIASVTGQREELLAYWLDLYYQVRRSYEIDQGREPDPNLIRREDLYPVIRELMKDALKSTAKDEAIKRAAKKAAGSTSSAAAAAPSPQGEGEEPEESRVRGWAKKKTLIRDRLLKARAEGVTIAQLTHAGGTDVCFETEIFGILNAAKVDMKSYRRVEAALEALGR